jgi:hypothetical protein
MKLDIGKLDLHIRFLQNEVKSLRDLRKVWSEAKAEKMNAIIETLTEVRRDQQMTGMNGKRIGERPDQVAVDAVPELQDKKALVCYFATDADRDEFAETLKQWMPNARSERIP